LCHYCQYELQPIFEDSLGGGRVERTRENVMGFMTEKFKLFFEKYKSVKSVDDLTWAVEKSPYEM
jgi:hypothetical protein